jgi:MoaA/NifB/PqqE/SkfB family radical SAM enzyme
MTPAVRSAVSFANINLLGPCNLDCRWCLGKELPELEGISCLSAPFREWPRFDEYLALCLRRGVRKLYITGQTTDALCYPDLLGLILHLQMTGFSVGIRTNGVLLQSRLVAANACDSVGVTILTRNPDTQIRMTGRGAECMPDWAVLIPKITPHLRISVVVDRFNAPEVEDLVLWLAGFPNVAYIQLRKVSTVERDFEIDRAAFEALAEGLETVYRRRSAFETAPVLDIGGKPVVLWRTVDTTANSLNYFCDGTISEDYRIVVGYRNARKETP